jgi:hypothetical protein
METYRRQQARAEGAEYERPEVVVRRRLRAGETLDAITDDLVRKALTPGYDFYDVIPDVIKMRAERGDERMKGLLELGEFQTEGYAVAALLPNLERTPLGTETSQNSQVVLSKDAKFLSYVNVAGQGTLYLAIRYNVFDQILKISSHGLEEFVNTCVDILGQRATYVQVGRDSEQAQRIQSREWSISPEEIVRKVLRYTDLSKLQTIHNLEEIDTICNEKYTGVTVDEQLYLIDKDACYTDARGRPLVTPTVFEVVQYDSDKGIAHVKPISDKALINRAFVEYITDDE